MTRRRILRVTLEVMRRISTSDDDYDFNYAADYSLLLLD